MNYENFSNHTYSEMRFSNLEHFCYEFIIKTCLDVLVSANLEMVQQEFGVVATLRLSFVTVLYKKTYTLYNDAKVSNLFFSNRNEKFFNESY